jgi:hypothetical protein
VAAHPVSCSAPEPADDSTNRLTCERDDEVAIAAALAARTSAAVASAVVEQQVGDDGDYGSHRDGDCDGKPRPPSKSSGSVSLAASDARSRRHCGPAAARIGRCHADHLRIGHTRSLEAGNIAPASAYRTRTGVVSAERCVSSDECVRGRFPCRRCRASRRRRQTIDPPQDRRSGAASASSCGRDSRSVAVGSSEG